MKRSCEDRVIEAPTSDGVWRAVQVCSQKEGKFLVRSEDGAEWDVDGPDIRERGLPVEDASVGDTVLLLRSDSPSSDGVEVEVTLKTEGAGKVGALIQVSCPAARELHETWVPLGGPNVCSLGCKVERQELLALCGKYMRKLLEEEHMATEAADAEPDAIAEGSEKPGLSKSISFTFSMDDSEFDVEQLANVPTPPPCLDLLQGIEVYAEGGGEYLGQNINGKLRHNPALSRWMMYVEDQEGAVQQYSLSDFISVFIKRKTAARTCILCKKTNEAVIPVYEELAQENRKWYVAVYTSQDERKREASAKSSSKSSSRPSKKKDDLDDPNNQPYNIPEWRFTPVIPDSRGVMLSPWDRAPQLRMADNNLSVSGYKGYRLVRATHGVSEGAWYCEATIREDFVQQSMATDKFLEVKGHSRLGWARSGAYHQGPVGYDRFGFAVCSKNGNKVHMRKPEPYAEPLQAGDVVGFYIYLPKQENPESASEEKHWEQSASVLSSSGAPALIKGDDLEADSRSDDKKKNVLRGTVHQPGGNVVDVKVIEAGSTFGGKDGARDQLEWKGTGVYFYLDEDKDTGTDVHDGSVIRFFVNGQPQGEAFRDVQAGTYYPAASLYMGGHVTYNFGPNFKFPLTEEPDGVPVRPIIELQPPSKEIPPHKERDTRSSISSFKENCSPAPANVDGAASPDLKEGFEGPEGISMAENASDLSSGALIDEPSQQEDLSPNVQPSHDASDAQMADSTSDQQDEQEAQQLQQQEQPQELQEPQQQEQMQVPADAQDAQIADRDGMVDDTSLPA